MFGQLGEKQREAGTVGGAARKRRRVARKVRFDAMSDRLTALEEEKKAKVAALRSITAGAESPLRGSPGSVD